MSASAEEGEADFVSLLFFLLLVNSGKTDVFPVQANPLPNYYLNFSLQDCMQVHPHSLCVG